MAKLKKIIHDRTFILYVIIFFVGLGIMLYPTLSNKWNEHLNNKLVHVYQDAAKDGSTNLEKEMKAAVRYNKNLMPTKVPDAFSTKDGKKDREYESILNICGNGMLGSIEIPSLDVEAPIYHYADEESLAKGAGHILGSSLPIGGRNSHAVIAAHRGLPSNKLFRDLDLMEIGDCFYIHILDKTLKYEVDQIEVVEPENTDYLVRDPEHDYITLVTCTPYGMNTHRLLVRGHRAPDDTVISEETKGNVKMILITLFCAIAGIIIAYFINRLTEVRKYK